MDSKGVMGFPMRLGIAFTLLALCLPGLSALAADFQDGASDTLMEKETGKLREVAGRVFYSGPGASETVDIELAPGYCIRLGGEGADAYAITTYRDSVLVDKTYMEHPQVMFLGDAFVIDSSGPVRLYCSNIPEYGLEVDRI